MQEHPLASGLLRQHKVVNFPSVFAELAQLCALGFRLCPHLQKGLGEKRILSLKRKRKQE